MADARQSEPQTVRLHDYRPPAFLVDSVKLDFSLEPDSTVVRSELVLRRNPAHGNDAAPLRLDGENQQLLSLVLDGESLTEIAYSLDEAGLTIPAVPDEFRLGVASRIDPEANSRLEGLYRSAGTYCTQCEAEGFRRITYYPDRPDVMATFRVRVEADKQSCPVLLSNGNLIEAGELDGNRHFAIWEDPFPKPSYLFALVAGDLAWIEDSFTTVSGRNVALKIYTDPGNEDRCGYAMDALKRSMRWDEEVYGLEYDLDIFNIVAIDAFNMGAMENKSLNVFNSKYILADPDTATDDDYAGIEAVVAHEYFHNWTGNRVTCRDWFQLSLKEGLTVFRDQQFSADQRSAPVKRIQDVRMLRAAQFPEDAGPLAHPVRPDAYMEINNFYTATVYEKGAEVIGMYHTLLGPERYRKGIDLYFERHDGQAVTCDDFLAAMADAGEADLEQFRLWYSQAGTPEIAVSGEYDAGSQTYALTLSQQTAPTPGQPDKAALHIPLAVGLVGPDGEDLPLEADGATTAVVELREPSQTFTFKNIAVLPVPSVNRGFSAPVKLRQQLDDEARALLMSRDSDAFNRWEAGQQYATDVLLAMIEEQAAGKTPHVSEHFVEAFAGMLDDTEVDRAFLALAVQLPSEGYLTEQMRPADPEAIHHARRALRLVLAERLRARWLELYRANQSNEQFSPDAASAGRRALKNAALSYLSLLDDPAMVALTKEQFDTADNMTDRMAALACLNERDLPQREASLSAFYERFRGNSLVVDKWFSVQAVSSLPGAVGRVEALLGHPAFSMKQPNKVRAVIGAFASGNPLHFHAADGSGYRFLADRILELDALNPQVAARMTTPLGRWRRYDENRQALMQAELNRILEKDGLSRDVYEIASKSLV